MALTTFVASIRASLRSPAGPAGQDTAGRGQGLAEYALILALIAIVSIVALLFLGEAISGIISDVGNSM